MTTYKHDIFPEDLEQILNKIRKDDKVTNIMVDNLLNNLRSINPDTDEIDNIKAQIGKMNTRNCTYDFDLDYYAQNMSTFAKYKSQIVLYGYETPFPYYCITDFYRDINSVFADVSSNLFFHKINPSQQRKFVLAKSNKTLFSEPNIVNERKIFNSSIDTKSIDTHQELSYAEVITPTNVHIVKDDDEDGNSIKVLIHSTILNPFWAYRTNNPRMSLTERRNLYEAIKYSILFKINYRIFKVTKTPIKITLDTNIDKIINAQNTKKWF